MSRIGKKPVVVPTGVTVERTSDRQVKVKGPKGELKLALRAEVDVKVEGGQVHVSSADQGREARTYQGTTRALIQNMVVGVQKGYQKDLEVVGVGWNASIQGQKIVLQVGYCLPVIIDVPPGIIAGTPSQTSIVLAGPDKQLIGQLAARIRSSRPPEPYKGKGVRYRGEYVRQKAGKSFGS